MNGDSNPSVGVDLRAVGSGMVWGLGLMVLGSLSQGVLDFVSPLGPDTGAVMEMVWPAAGALTGGFLAARRAAGTGWLHGVLAGAGLVLCLGTIMGVASGLPTLAWLLKVGGISAGAGVLGGVLGVNSSGQ
jgi:putative membrane protein (TIGR04086 family)